MNRILGFEEKYNIDFIGSNFKKFNFSSKFLSKKKKDLYFNSYFIHI